MRCTKPIKLFNVNSVQYPRGLEVPCGKCIECRIQKAKEWSMRIMHELDSWDDSLFVTLSYSNDFIPENRSLKKKDMQLFLKRLRKLIAPRKIKYFLCGEYSPDSHLIKKWGEYQLTDGQRPHYHAIIFGLSLRDEDKEVIKKAWSYCDWKTQKNAFGLVEPDSARYVASYINSKLSGDMAKEQYDDKGREPVFRLLSQGLGKNYALQYDVESITFRGVPQSSPRYYLNVANSKGNKRREAAKDKQRDLNEKLCGVRITDDELFRTDPNEVRISDVVQGKYKNDHQRERNAIAKVNLKRKSKI